MIAGGDQPEEKEGAGGRSDEDQRDPAVDGKADREPDQRRSGSEHRDQIGGPGTRPGRRNLVAKERRRTDLARPAERIEGEGDRGQEPIGKPERQLDRVDGAEPDREGAAEDHVGKEGDRGTDGEADRAREERNQDDLEEIDRNGEIGRPRRGISGSR